MVLLAAIRKFAFWGIVFLLILTLGFQVPVRDIWLIASGTPTYLTVYCWYMLTSVPLYLFLLVVLYFYDGLTVKDILISEIWASLRVAYKGFDLRDLPALKKLDPDDYWRQMDFETIVRRLINTVLLWTIIVTEIYAIYHSGNNAILAAIEARTPAMRLLILGVSVVLLIALGIITGRMNKKLLMEMLRERMQEMDDAPKV